MKFFKRPKIFINYRRQDSSGHAGRLFDDIADVFGKSNITMDIDRIEGGERYMSVIEEEIRSADVILVIIGRIWITVQNEKGNQRLFEPKDLVKKEILIALEHKKKIIPVLIQDSRMPTVEELPAEIQELSELHAMEVSDIRWQYDVRQLTKTLSRIHRRKERSLKWPASLLILVLVLAVVMFLTPLRKKLFSFHAGLLKDSVVNRIPDSSYSNESANIDSTESGNQNPRKPVDIVGVGFTADAFKQYVPALRFREWKPKFVVLHHTAVPTLSQWHKQPASQRLQFMAQYFGENLQWTKGPHLLIDDDSIWVFNDLDKPGIHSLSWNKISWGIEMVGDYNKEPVNQKVLDNTVSAIATLLRRLKLPADSIHFHSEDPRTPGKICPGKNINKQEIIKRVAAQLN